MVVDEVSWQRVKGTVSRRRSDQPLILEGESIAGLWHENSRCHRIKPRHDLKAVDLSTFGQIVILPNGN